MSTYYFWYVLYEEENKTFNALVNGDKKYNHKKIVKQTFANDNKISMKATVSKFANDK